MEVADIAPDVADDASFMSAPTPLENALPATAVTGDRLIIVPTAEAAPLRTLFTALGSLSVADTIVESVEQM